MGLNRILNNLFISYKCELPEHFFLGHAFGTIIGNACFDDFLCVSHLVTINTGNEIDGKRTPHIGRGVWFGPNSKLIGDKKIGDRVSIGVDAVVYDKEVKDDSIVVNRGKGIEILDNKREICKAQQYFKVKI